MRDGDVDMHAVTLRARDIHSLELKARATTRQSSTPSAAWNCPAEIRSVMLAKPIPGQTGGLANVARVRSYERRS
jgi:hypothetical protein